MADADTFQRHRGLVDLPPAVLERIVSAAWAPSARAPSASSRTSGGVAALCSLSVACRTLRAACDASLAELAEVTRADCAALRAASSAPRGPPSPAAASAVMRRLLCCMRSVQRLDLGDLHFWVHDMALQAGRAGQRARRG